QCVGDSNIRFQEDALRILRALRFASMYGLQIESLTVQAIFTHKELLKNLSAERVFKELCKTLLGNNIRDILLEYAEIFFVFLPELEAMKDFPQNNKAHIFDVYRHTAETVYHAKADIIIRLTMLLHDIGKPQCHKREADFDHFPTHPKVSAEIAKNILTRLKADSYTMKTVLILIEIHNLKLFPEAIELKKRLRDLGPELLYQLVEVQRADAKGKSDIAREKILARLQAVTAVLDELMSQKAVYSLKDLAVTGEDLKALGMQSGKEIGQMLKDILELVIEEKIANDRDKILAMVKVHL
ncbi:MAG: HD domain-containing protein, partial [Candidatus Cloacimonetes bacterium]|nr:HD domain-containing protein [Candidatus Cloacimonadota bacterium]